MLRRLFFVLISLLAVTVTRAQNDPFLQNYAKQLAGGAEVNFSLTTHMNNQEVYASQGLLKVMGDKFRLTFAEFDICYNGEVLTVYDASEHTFSIMKPTERELLQTNPILVLCAKPSLFHVATTSAKGNTKLLKLTPAINGVAFKAIELLFKGSPYAIDTIQVMGVDNSQTKINITQIKYNNRIPEQTFIQTKEQYPNCEVMDLR